MDESQSEFPARPLPLIEIRGENELVVNEETAKLLSKISCPVCPIVVVGLYRTGKSTLLNMLRRELGIDSAGGFEVGPSIQRCTRGVWVWGRPYFVGDKAALLMDTEGIGGLEADAQYDSRIFALSSLIASSLVYNSLGSIDEHAIAQLSFVARLSEHVTFFDSTTKDDESEAETVAKLSEFMPSFTWVVRDFSLELASAHGDAITSDEYLESALHPQRGYDAGVLERNRLRQVVKAFFRSRACKTLVRPVVDEKDLAPVDQLAPSKLRPQFVTELDDLRDHLFAPERLQAKTLGLGKATAALRGPAYVELLDQFCDAFNTGGVPAVVSAWDHVSKIESDAALDEAIQTFDDALASALSDDDDGARRRRKNGSSSRKAASSGDFLDSDDDDDVAPSSSKVKILDADAIEDAVASATRAAVAVFEKRALGDAAFEAKQQLEDAIRARAADHRRANKRASQRYCEGLAEKLYVDTVAKTLDGLSNVRLLDDVDEQPPVAVVTKKKKKKSSDSTTSPSLEKKTPAGTKKKKKSTSPGETSSSPDTVATRRPRPSSIALTVDPIDLAGRLTTTWTDFRSRYTAQAAGPASEAVLLTFLAEKWPVSCHELVRRLEAMHDLDRAREQAKLLKLKAELAEHQGQTDARARMLEDSQQSLISAQMDKAKMEAKADAASKQLKTNRKDANRQIKDLEAKVANLELQLDDAQERLHLRKEESVSGPPSNNTKHQVDVVDNKDCKCRIS